jgi:hypothetical protein
MSLHCPGALGRGFLLEDASRRTIQLLQTLRMRLHAVSISGQVCHALDAVDRVHGIRHGEPRVLVGLVIRITLHQGDELGARGQQDDDRRQVHVRASWPSARTG